MATITTSSPRKGQQLPVATGGRATAPPSHGRAHWHSSDQSGKLRAGVFGANDGLVSNLSLVMGVAGAHPGASVVLLSGVAGLLAGAFSMAAGEYISVRTQRERYEHLLSIERRELIEDPDEEQAELAAIYAAKGIPQQDAERIAAHLIRDPETALDTMAREELGLNPQDLGSPITAAASSFLMFAIGAILPVLPYLFLAEGAAFIAAAVLGAAGLLAVGGAVSLVTARGAWTSALRMFAIGGSAAVITYLVGNLIGVSV
jgi:VIT1/CCC1 family predicted Fe2+/Mn2+ transporter